MRLIRPLLPVLIIALLAPASASAISRPVVGIADQKASTFDQQRFRSLKVRRSRVVVPWNVALVRGERDRLRGWMAAARRAGVREVMVAFNHTRGQECPRRPCTLPSKRSYTRAFRAFRRQFKSVRIIQPWNEANSPTQPTGPWRKGARYAAYYYNIVKRHCRRCTVTAADVLDLSKRTMARWLRQFKRYAQGKPRLWGLHNYTDTNKRSGLTRAFLRMVRGKVWVTETGAIHYFQLQSGRVRYAYNERRAASAMRRTFSIANKYRSRIRRLYLYHWSIDFAGNRFDAGIVNADGSPRRAYYVVRKYRSQIR